MSTAKEQAYAEIMNLFRYYYKNTWTPDNIFSGKSRTWVRAFNQLVEQGFIIKKKQVPGYAYKWSGIWPDKF